MLNGFRFRVGPPLSRGGVWLAQFQILPVLHVGSGYLAGWVWWKLSGVELGTPAPQEGGGTVLLSHNVAAFLATLAAALPLSTAAVLVDTFERWLRGEFDGPRGDG